MHNFSWKVWYKFCNFLNFAKKLKISKLSFNSFKIRKFVVFNWKKNSKLFYWINQETFTVNATFSSLFPTLFCKINKNIQTNSTNLTIWSLFPFLFRHFLFSLKRIFNKKHFHWSHHRLYLFTKHKYLHEC